MEKALPLIPAKRYFTIGEVSDLCGVKPHVLRYWEQEFTQLRPIKRRGNRRYYQHHEVLMIRRIRDLLYDQGFTISGARNKMLDAHQSHSNDRSTVDAMIEGIDVIEISDLNAVDCSDMKSGGITEATSDSMLFVRRELFEIRALLSLTENKKILRL